MNNSKLSPLLKRVMENDHFVGHRLAHFQQVNDLDEIQLASFLCCGVEQLPRLALCVAPTQKDNFAVHVQKLASFVGCDQIKLATLIRQSDAVQIATKRVAEHGANYTLAARDQKSDQNPADDDGALGD